MVSPEGCYIAKTSNLTENRYNVIMSSIAEQKPKQEKLTLTAQEKYDHLKSILQEMGSVLVALSGGIDSVFLMKVSHDTLGDKALGVTCDSASFPSEERDLAIHLAKDFGFRHLIVNTDELEDENYVSNPINRCYFCRVEMYDTLGEIAQKHNLAYVVDGYNFSDTGDYRPGRKAANERQVRSPLYESQLTKKEIRSLAKELGLPNWDRPASACLSSRIPYGLRVTVDRLKQIDEAEKFIHSLGIRQVRVRHHENMARIEVEMQDIPKLYQPHIHQQVVERLHALGFSSVTIDPKGYRTGSLNEGVE